LCSGGGRGGFKGGAKVTIEPHRHEGKSLTESATTSIIILLIGDTLICFAEIFLVHSVHLFLNFEESGQKPTKI